MIRWWYPILAAVLIVLATGYWLAAQQVGEGKPDPVGDSEPGEVEDGVFGVYHPDRPAPLRARTDSDTFHAKRIVLTGRDMTIVLDADVGITMTDKTGQAIVLYIRDGRAVIGIRQRGAPNLPAAIFAAGDGGFLQLREAGGAHVLRPAEIVNRR